jgi:hypothetical protein
MVALADSACDDKVRLIKHSTAVRTVITGTVDWLLAFGKGCRPSESVDLKTDC